MPDLKSQLEDVKHKLSTLAFDDEGEATEEQVITAPRAPGRVSVTLFNIIRDNPGCNRKRLLILARGAGVEESSSTSLLTQFAKRGLIHKEDGPSGLTYFASLSEYKPGYVKQRKKPKKAKEVETPVMAAVVQVAPQDATVQELLNNISIVKARALYDELKKIFGG